VVLISAQLVPEHTLIVLKSLLSQLGSLILNENMIVNTVSIRFICVAVDYMLVAIFVIWVTIPLLYSLIMDLSCVYDLYHLVCII
jgi:hypothetical protein